ncbi:IgA peptidase M64 [Aureococcus anophagefferens]|nr:IgA peptidase M64 [Aureococcus anophagefferens]
MTEPSSSFTKLVRRDVGSSLIFLAEGYAAHERDAFLGDVRRLYDEVLGSPDAPLRHVSAFFSVDAIFVPSATSGVPRLATLGAERGGTAFGLYRDAAQPLRLVEPSRWSYDEARERCGALHERPALCDRERAAPCCWPTTLLRRPRRRRHHRDGVEDVGRARAAPRARPRARRRRRGVRRRRGLQRAQLSLSAAPCGPGAAPRTYETTVDGIAATRTIWPCAPWLERNASVAGRTALALAAWPFAALRVGENRTFSFASDLDFAKLEFSVSGGVGVDAYVDGVRADVAYKTPPTADGASPERVALGRRRRHAVTLSATETARAAAAAPWHPEQMVCHVQVHAMDRSVQQRAAGRRRLRDVRRPGRLVGYRPTVDGCCMRDVAKACFCPVCRDLLLRRRPARARLFGAGLGPRADGGRGRGDALVPAGPARRRLRRGRPGGPAAGLLARRRDARVAGGGPLGVFESSATVAVDAPWSSSLIASSADTSVFTSSVNAKPPETKYFSGSSPAWDVSRSARAGEPLADAVDPAARVEIPARGERRRGRAAWMMETTPGRLLREGEWPDVTPYSPETPGSVTESTPCSK